MEGDMNMTTTMDMSTHIDTGMDMDITIIHTGMKEMTMRMAMEMKMRDTCTDSCA